MSRTIRTTDRFPREHRPPVRRQGTRYQVIAAALAEYAAAPERGAVLVES